MTRTIEVWTPSPEDSERFRNLTEEHIFLNEPEGKGLPDVEDPDDYGDPEWVEKALLAVPIEELLAETKGLPDTDPDPSPNPGARKLRRYWTRGAGAAKIRWGTSGDFMRCVRHLGKYVEDPKGLCNVYHRSAVGAPPGKGHKSAEVPESPLVTRAKALLEERESEA